MNKRVIVSSREEDTTDNKRIRMALRTIVHSLLPDQETYSVAVRRQNLHLPIGLLVKRRRKCIEYCGPERNRRYGPVAFRWRKHYVWQPSKEMAIELWRISRTYLKHRHIEFVLLTYRPRISTCRESGYPLLKPCVGNVGVRESRYKIQCLLECF